MSIHKRPDGSYIIRYYADGRRTGRRVQETLRGPDGKPLPFADAVRIYRERLALASARRGTSDDSRVTFSMLAETYIEFQKSESAKARTRQTLRQVPEGFKGRVVRTLTPLDIERLRKDRSANVKPSTVNREWAVLKAILNFGEKKRMIERNPIRRGEVPMFKPGPGRLVFFEPEEWERFVTAFEDEARWKQHRTRIRRLGPMKEGLLGLRRYGGGMNPDSEATAEYRERLRATVPFFKATLYTGSRPGEILRLTWQDVDFERGRLSVWQEKTQEAKTVPMSKALREVLSALPRGIGAAAVFMRPDGEALTEDDYKRAFGVARRLAGLRKELNPYSIRHTFASWLAIKGTPIRTIQELLGHKDLRMTLRYAHLSPAHLAEAVETVEAVEKSSRRHLVATSSEAASQGAAAKPLDDMGKTWWPQRESNPRSGLESERLASKDGLGPIRLDSPE